VTPVLEVDGLTKRFGGVAAVDHCSLAVAEGTVTALIGPNGSGKTTLFNVITGYERIQQGEVRFGGKEITNAPPDRVFGLGIGRTFGSIVGAARLQFESLGILQRDFQTMTGAVQLQILGRESHDVDVLRLRDQLTESFQ